MIIYRKTSLPALAANWKIVKRSPVYLFVTIDEFKPFRRCIEGEDCISENFEDADCWVVALETPSVEEFLNSLRRSDGTGDRSFTLKKWVIPFKSIAGSENCENETWEEARLDRAKIRSLAAIQSVIPSLSHAAKALSVEVLSLSKRQKDEIAAREEKLFAMLRLQKEKRKLTHTRSESSGDSLSGRVKNSVYQKHGYKCFFTGEHIDHSTLEIHHLIPKRVIELLHLDPSLYTAEFNLVPCEKSLNLAKGAEIHPADINHCFDRIKDETHPNWRLLPFLEKIRVLQPLTPTE